MKKIMLAAVLILTGGFVIFGQTPGKGKKTIIRKNVAKVAVKQTKSAVVKLEREKFDPVRDAVKDLSDAIAETQKSGKRIILDIGGEWCPWCINMDNFFLQNAELAKLRDENFIWLKINFSEANENKEFLRVYPEIEAYPHLFVLEKDGKLIYSKNTEELEEGKSYNLQRFSDFLKEYAAKKTDTK